jgi:hypothetical protein
VQLPRPKALRPPAPGCQLLTAAPMGDTAPSNKQEPLRTERKILKKMMSKALPGFERPFKDSFPQLWDGYKLIIAEPMDFGTIRRKLKEVLYMPATGHVIHPDFIREMELVYTNCIHYNAPETEYYVHAQHMLELFRRKVKEKPVRRRRPRRRTRPPPPGGGRPRGRSHA